MAWSAMSSSINSKPPKLTKPSTLSKLWNEILGGVMEVNMGM